MKIVSCHKHSVFFSNIGEFALFFFIACLFVADFERITFIEFRSDITFAKNLYLKHISENIWEKHKCVT